MSRVSAAGDDVYLHQTTYISSRILKSFVNSTRECVPLL